MASIISTYFPPLDQCLSGEKPLLSWKAAFVALEEDVKVGQKSLRRFLGSSDTIDSLVQHLKPKANAPAGGKRAQFDNYTSAINVTPDANGGYDLQQMKDDALWLSKEAKIDEVAALRTIIIEWQDRVKARLSQEPALEDMTDFSGSMRLKSSLLRSRLNSRPQEPKGSIGDFDSETARRLRILHTFLLERRCQFKFLGHVLFITLCEELTDVDDLSNDSARRLYDRWSWVKRAGTEICEAWIAGGDSSTGYAKLLDDVIAVINEKQEYMLRGSRITVDAAAQIDLEFAWWEDHTTEIIHLLHIVSTVARKSEIPLSARTLSAWFELMEPSGFFGLFELPYEELNEFYLHDLQSLAVLASLSLINLPLALRTISGLSSTVATGGNAANTIYVQEPSCVERITTILLEAVSSQIVSIHPLSLAWGILLQEARDLANISTAARDNRQAERAAETVGSSAISDTESNDGDRRRPSPNRRTSFGSDTSQQLTCLEEVIDAVQRIDPGEDSINVLGVSAFNDPGALDVMADLAIRFCQSFGAYASGLFGLKIRQTLLELIDLSLPQVPYQQKLVAATLDILTGGHDFWDLHNAALQPLRINLISPFRASDSLMERIFHESRRRFPYESLSFLKLCSALVLPPAPGRSTDALVPYELEGMQSLTSLFYEEDAQYELCEEDNSNNANSSNHSMYIVLTTPLDILATGQGGSLHHNQLFLTSGTPSRGRDPAQVLVLPPGTRGRPITDIKPLVIMFNYEYSGLCYIGLVLREAARARSKPRVELTESIFEIATEMIGLLSRMLAAAVTSTQSGQSLFEAQENAKSILELASNALGNNQDIVSVILEMFEDELYDPKAREHGLAPTEFLVHCSQFVFALIPVLPGRVWPFLGRSGLLGLQGGVGRLSNIVSALEVPSGQFPFLTSTAHIFEALVDDAVTNAIVRRGSTTQVTRFASAPNSRASGITEPLMRTILLGFEKIMIGVLQSVTGWRFSSGQQQLEVVTIICGTFAKILSYCYDTDDDQDISKKIPSALGPSAEYLLDVFLSATPNDLPTQPLIQALHNGLHGPTETYPMRDGRARIEMTSTLLEFTNQLIRTNTYLSRPISRLQQQIYNSTPTIARCYPIHERYRVPVVKLLDALVRGSNHNMEQPASLLGHLGQHVAGTFVDLLAKSEQLLDDKDLGEYIWRLLSGVVSERQQWFAIYILTGRTPKEALKAKTSRDAVSRSHPVFQHAMSRLRNISHTDFKESGNIMEFITRAADFWPSVTEHIWKDAEAMKALTEFLVSLEDLTNNSDRRQTENAIYRTQIASSIVSIFAITAHRCNEIRDRSFYKLIDDSLSFLVRRGVSFTDYNPSLHSNLRRNFEARFPGVNLAQFKRTPIRHSELGQLFYYDVEYATRLLRHNPAWFGQSDRGFYNEFIQANVNLSAVEAQINLYHAWKSLLVELSVGLDISGRFQEEVAQVIKDCLAFNSRPKLPEAVFAGLEYSRASLAFTLLQRLISTGRTSDHAKSILRPAWQTLQAIAPDIGNGLTGSDSEYVRVLVKIIYLALQAYLPAAKTSTSTSTSTADTSKKDRVHQVTLVLEILRTCVAGTFRSLVSVLHDDVSKVTPSDFALINSILRTCLQIQDVDRQTEQLVSMFADNNTALYASTLLSWSHELTIEKDPIFGELSLTLLYELSNVPVLAEYIVTAGTMGQIATATLMNYLHRPEGSGPFDEPVRVYSIWTRALLPLIINILTAIGAPMAGDIGTFVNQFGPQLERASVTMGVSDGRGSLPRSNYMTFTMASEAHSLAIISTILGKFRDAGASAGVIPAEIPQLAWDGSNVKSDLDHRLQRRMALREDIVPTDDREEELSILKSHNAQVGAENKLEERIVIELSSAMELLANTDP